MIEIKKVLFTTDFSPSGQFALNHALFLAEQYNTELHLLHVIQTHRHDMIEPMAQVPNAEEIYKMLCENAVVRLQEMVAGKQNGITIITHAVRGVNIPESIIEYVTDNDIDVVVMGTHGRHGVSRLLMGSVSEKVVRLAPCSVLTVHEGNEIDPQKAMHNVVMPIDFSKDSKTALRVAIEVAETYKADLHVLHVIEKINFPAVYASSQGDLQDWLPDIKKRSYREIERLLKEYGGKQTNKHIHIHEGHAAREIISFTQEIGADLVVIAPHGLRGINYLMMGSVSEKVVRFSKCPVLTVKNKAIAEYLEDEKISEKDVV